MSFVTRKFPGIAVQPLLTLQRVLLVDSLNDSRVRPGRRTNNSGPLVVAFIDLCVRGEMLLRLVSYGPLSGRRLPGDGVLANLSDETLSGWASVNVARRMGQVLLVGPLNEHPVF